MAKMIQTEAKCKRKKKKENGEKSLRFKKISKNVWAKRKWHGK